MGEIKLRLIQKAIDEYKRIFPCTNAKHLNDCFTFTGNRLFFWFNTEDNSTHIVIEEI